MENDLEFANDNAVPESANPMYDLLFGGGTLGEDEAERRVGQRTIPRFDYYILNLEGGKGIITNDGQPGVSAMARVIEGPDGTEGAVVFGRQYLTVKPTKVINVTLPDGTRGKKEVERTPEEIEKAASEIRMTLKKVVRVTGAAQEVPSSTEEEDLSLYASQFQGPCVGAVTLRKERTDPKTGETYPESNELILRSLASFDEPVVDKKGSLTGETALEEARRKIAEFNAKAARREGGGRTARTYGASSEASEF